MLFKKLRLLIYGLFKPKKQQLEKKWSLVMTIHGKERVMERVKCSEGKARKIVGKALIKGKQVSREYHEYQIQKVEHRNRMNTFYRVHMGFVYVFKKIPSQKKILFITTFSPKGNRIKPLAR